MAKTVDEAIDSLGFGKFSLVLIFAVSIFYMAEASELNLISIISPELRCLWNLSNLETSLLSSVTFFGMFLGSLYWGFLSDMHGRKIMLVVGAFFTAYFGLLSSSSYSYVWYLVTRFFVGIGLGSVAFITNFIGEFVVAKHRGKSVVSANIFYAFGSLYVAVTALLLVRTTSWRLYLIVATIPPLLFLLSSIWLPESIHYLKVTGKYDEIIKILHRMSVTNKVPMPTVNFEYKLTSKSTSKRGNIKILFSNKYGWKMAIMIILFITGQSSYFSLVLMNTELLQTSGFCTQSFTSNQSSTICYKLNSDDYVQNIYVVFAEFPGMLIPTILIDRIGRKPYLIAGYLISGFGFLCINICLSNVQGTILMFALRCLTVGISQVPYVLCTELFPTIVRTTALGILVGSSRCVLICIPYLVESLLHTSKLATTAIFASFCFLTSVLVLLLPETKNSSLIDS